MKLAEYRSAHSLSQKAFADLIGATQGDIARYEAGRIPRPRVMLKIFQVTKGQVRADDFFGLPPIAEYQAA